MHAVTDFGTANDYSHDANGNQTQRVIGSDTYDLTYDAEGQLVEVKKNSAVFATFVYDGAGNRVKATVNGNTSAYVGAHFEYDVINTTIRSYYAGVAMRVDDGTNNDVFWRLKDHLGGTSLTLNDTGGVHGELFYIAFGETLYISGTTPTDIRYTGQREEADIGLYFYNARWYDPALGRFAQADTILPNPANSKAFDRYAYVYNNPLKYIDPSGNCPDGADIIECFIDFIDLFAPIAIPPGVSKNIYRESSKLQVNKSIWMGKSPDYRGIATAEKYVDPGGDYGLAPAIVVAAGIAVQSQWYAPWKDSRNWITSWRNSGIGIAQVSDAQMKEYGVSGDQVDPFVAVEAMAARINRVLAACHGCSTVDLLIAAALAQNGSFWTADTMRDAPRNTDGTVNWENVFRDYDSVSDPLARFREFILQTNYNTKFMLLLFLQDLRALHAMGYELPWGLTLEDLDQIEEDYID